MNQVLEIIKQRHHSGSMPGKRDDPYKVALCIEGGGLRGIVSGGALSTLHTLGYKNSFDVIYGSSSGAYCAAFFAADDIFTGPKFFFDYSQKQFISIKRMLRGEALFDLDYVNHIIHDVLKINFHRAIKSNPPLHIVATDAVHDRPITIKDFHEVRDLDRALKASSTFPPFRNPHPLLFRHKHYLDAAILDPFCLHSAVKEGATHIVALFSMPIHRRHAPGIVDRQLVSHYFNKINPNLGETFLHHGEYSINGLGHVWNHFDGTHILAIAPRKGRKLPAQLTRKRGRLGSGFLAGAEAVLDHLSPDKHTGDLIMDNFKREFHIK